MKKTILATMLSFYNRVHSFFFSADPGELETNGQNKFFSDKNPTVNADVTIVLTEGNNQQVNMIGDETFM